jgi:putative membrane protein
VTVEQLLARFGVDGAHPLGRGSEAAVYALDDRRVLRVYHQPPPRGYVERRVAFYTMLQGHGLPFELPLVLECGQHGQHAFCVERRMRGREFARVLPSLEGAERTAALLSYATVAIQIGGVELPDTPFGELLTYTAPLRRGSWPAYALARLRRNYQAGRADLERDLPGADRALRDLRARLATLEGFAERRLVHGDYFPGNVYIDEQHAICGVGDFGYSTVVGDPRLDLAGALAFVEVVPGYREPDSALIEHMLVERFGDALAPWLATYRLYYSFYFCGCKADDTHTYGWCVANIRAWLQAHA